MMHSLCGKPHQSANSHKSTHNNEAQFKRLTQKPPIAYPTILLFIATLTVLSTSTGLFFLNQLPLLWAVLANTVGLYLTFTVLHDASHRSIARHISTNDWIGRAAIFLIQPAAPLSAFRYLHMQHHRFANTDKDPDMFIAKGPLYIRVIKCLFFDIFYMYFYLQSIKTRPKKDRLELLSTVFLFLTLATLFMAYDIWLSMLLIWFLPSRLANLILSLAFAYLPHYPHQTAQKNNPFQTTSIRDGWEWLLTPLMLGQNYHLVHHLYPAVPFYRYRRLWLSRLRYHQAKKPNIVPAFKLQADHKQKGPSQATATNHHAEFETIH